MKIKNHFSEKQISKFELLLDKIFVYGHTSTQFKRIFKAAFLTTLCFALACIDKTDKVLGNSYLCALLSVSMHPGRRLGAMMQTLVVALAGIAVGLPYAILAHFLSQKVEDATGDFNKAHSIYIVFSFFVLLAVGYVRSAAPRFFPFVFVMFLISHFSFISPQSMPIDKIAQNFGFPLTLALLLSFLVNVAIFPEFGSTYIGSTVIQSVHELQVMLSKCSNFFITPHVHDYDDLNKLASQLGQLVSQKKKVRSSLQQCSSTMTECTYEFSYSFMAPQELKPVVKNLQSLYITTNSLHVSCELELGVFAGYMNGIDDLQTDPEVKDSLIHANSHSHAFVDLNKGYGKSDDSDSDSWNEKMSIESDSDEEKRDLLTKFINSVREPTMETSNIALESMNLIKRVLAVAYDAPNSKTKIFSAQENKYIDYNEEKMGEQYAVTVENIDKYLAALVLANSQYSKIVRGELSKISSEEVDLVYLVPQEEYFVLSLFILNFRQTCITISKMLSQCRALLETRKLRESQGLWGRKIWFSVLTVKRNWKQFVSFGYEEPIDGDSNSILSARRNKHEIEDEEEKGPHKFITNRRFEKNKSWNEKGSSDDGDDDKRRIPLYIRFKESVSYHQLTIRRWLASILDQIQKKDLHLKNAFKTVLVVFIVSFPGYSSDMSRWYADLRGTWVGFAALIALETNLGATLLGYIWRTLFVAIGSAWGLVLYVAGGYGSNRYLMTFMAFVGLLPFYYIMLYSPYGKGGMMGTVSLCIVPLSTLRNHGIPGTIFENFGKRTLSMIIGGAVAMLVNLIVFPQKARFLLVDQLIYSLKFCQLLQIQMGLALNGETSSASQVGMVRDQKKYEKFIKKARSALSSSDGLLSIAKKEPRLKGPFDKHAKIYKEIIFVINQILDRFESIKFLREQYGSAVLDELSPYTYLYRREVYGTTIALLRTSEEALFTKKPIPQFMPSSRIAHLRVVNAVRKYLFDRIRKIKRDEERVNHRQFDNTIDLHEHINRKGNLKIENDMLRNKYMSWSATSVGTEEVIEYVEELISLIKNLVGTRRFQHGFLSRPLFDYFKDMGQSDVESYDGSDQSDQEAPVESNKKLDTNNNNLVPMNSRNSATSTSSYSSSQDVVPFPEPFIKDDNNTTTKVSRQMTLELPKQLRKRNRSFFMTPNFSNTGLLNSPKLLSPVTSNNPPTGIDQNILLSDISPTVLSNSKNVSEKITKHGNSSINRQNDQNSNANPLPTTSSSIPNNSSSSKINKRERSGSAASAKSLHSIFNNSAKATPKRSNSLANESDDEKLPLSLQRVTTRRSKKIHNKDKKEKKTSKS